jgi:hypothetical protein
VIAPERSKILDLAVLPPDCTKLQDAGKGIQFAVLRYAYDYTIVVDAQGVAAVASVSKRAQVGDAVMAPLHGVENLIGR